jgi:hypothetical protein
MWYNLKKLILTFKSYIKYVKNLNHITCVIVGMLAGSVVDRGFEPWSVKTKRILNWYLLFLHWAHSFKEREQRLVGVESG